MIATTSVRLRRQGEILSEALRTEYELCKIDPEWHWLVECNGKIVAQVLTANAHGILLFLRITATEDAPKSWSLIALRRVLSEAKKRGCTLFLAMLEDKQPAEVQLMRIAMKAGAVSTPFYGCVMAGSIEGR